MHGFKPVVEQWQLASVQQTDGLLPQLASCSARKLECCLTGVDLCRRLVTPVWLSLHPQRPSAAPPTLASSCTVTEPSAHLPLTFQCLPAPAEAFSRAGYFSIECEAPNPRLYSFQVGSYAAIACGVMSSCARIVQAASTHRGHFLGPVSADLCAAHNSSGVRTGNGHMKTQA